MQNQNQNRGWLASTVPALTFLIGVVLGGLVIGLAGDDGGEPDAGPVATNGSEPTPTSDVTVVVPDACIEAAATVTEAVDLIRDGVGAVRDFRPQELVDLLDELEDLDARARDLALQCSEVGVSGAP